MSNAPAHCGNPVHFPVNQIYIILAAKSAAGRGQAWGEAVEAYGSFAIFQISYHAFHAFHELSRGLAWISILRDD